jgi:putative membrane protein
MAGIFSKQSLISIEAAVKAAEKLSSSEIVPMAVDSSGFYAWVHWFWSVVFLVISVVSVEVWNHSGFWPLELREVFIVQLLFMGVGCAFSFIPFVKRNTIPRFLRDGAVHEAAQANFLTHGIHLTRERTGILIYISLLEHQVEILADQGIHQKLGAAFWDQMAQKIAQGIAQGKADESLIAVIESMGQKLAEFFPRRHDDTNELSDTLRK